MALFNFLHSVYGFSIRAQVDRLKKKNAAGQAADGDDSRQIC